MLADGSLSPPQAKLVVGCSWANAACFNMKHLWMDKSIPVGMGGLSHKSHSVQACRSINCCFCDAAHHIRFLGVCRTQANYWHLWIPLQEIKDVSPFAWKGSLKQPCHHPQDTPSPQGPTKALGREVGGRTGSGGALKPWNPALSMECQLALSADSFLIC